jgi:hypothetical protein
MFEMWIEKKLETRICRPILADFSAAPFFTIIIGRLVADIIQRNAAAQRISLSKKL